MRQLHPVFAVVKLMPTPVDPILGRQSSPPSNPVLVDGEKEYEVETILDSRIFRDGKGMVVNTITGKMPGKYTLQSWLWNFTPPIPKPPIKSIGPSLTTLPSGHYEIVMSGCHSLVGG